MDPFVVMAAASQVTKTIKFDTGVLPSAARSGNG
jgi:alkanesulfonate monooxygenase SsuD/methylene tetrahydromethanopterin reductase-like flavin-dependent oxidoreductase (luciferase family)